MIRKNGDEVIGINRKGLVVALPQPIAQHARAIGPRQWLMDGEAIGDVYYAFDLLEQDGVDLRKEPYSQRLGTLSVIVPPGRKDVIRARDTATGTARKREMLAALRRLKAEGVVFKRHAAPYTPGRPASGGDQLKLKFTATASCIVDKVNGSKRSVALVLLDGDKRIGVGNVTIPVNQQIPPVESIVEVRFLYAFLGGSLFQPVFLGLRDDIGPDACTVSQLKYKGGDSEEAESGEEGQPT